LRPRVSEALPMASFAEGLQRLARRQATGRIVLRVKPELAAIQADTSPLDRVVHGIRSPIA